MPQRLVATALLVTFAACSQDPGYHAKIRRTSYGIAHIEAADLGSLGFGEGYAQAEDHLCSLADQVVKVRGERSKYFGRGSDDGHWNNDVVMRALAVHERAAADLAAEADEVRAWYRGFADGYNRFLAETGRDQVPGWCRGEPWVQPITADDLAAYLRHVTVIITRFESLIAGASPPAASGLDRAADGSIDDLERALPAVGASNGWALGSEWSQRGRGMLVANPHYPWVGSNRFWEKHLTIPGEMDVYGVGLIGMPGVAIGFNRHVAWTHTVSAGTRFTIMSLDLVPGDPTRYRYGDEERALEAKAIAVEVRDGSGNVETVKHRVWFSHQGPIVDLPGLGWTDERAFAVRDANEDNDEARRQWLDMARATSLDAFQAVHAEHQGMPWVNTIATSAEGRAWYADASATPNLRPEAIAAWIARRESDPLTRALWQDRGMVLLDGSDPLFDWQDDPRSRDPGIVPYQATPQIERRDYVWNANDSFWLANAAAPIEGDFSPLHGEQRTVRSLRSRNNELTLGHRSPDRPAGGDRKFDLEELAQALLANRSHAAELLRDALVERCGDVRALELDGRRFGIAKACAVLKAWDGRFDVDSRGPVLFREWITRYAPDDLRDAGELFAVGFDPDDPIHTPRGLARPAVDPDPALVHLARAADLLRQRGIGLATPLGRLQFHDKAGRRIPVHGGDGAYEGLLNLQRNGRNRTTLEPLATAERVEGSRFLTDQGYPVVHGSSFILVLEYTDSGPNAKAILTYAQSGDPSSEHHVDQTELFAQKKLRPVLFDEAAIAADVKRSYDIEARP